MCWICLDFRDGLLSAYDASIISYDLPDPNHAEKLRELIKQLSQPKPSPIEDRPVDGDEQVDDPISDSSGYSSFLGNFAPLKSRPITLADVQAGMDAILNAPAKS